MDRRRFVRSTLAASAAGVTLPGVARAAWPHPSRFGAPIGLQLYTVRSLMGESVDRTLELVAEIGYEEVEFAGLFDRTPRQVRETLDRVGLSAPATHHGIDVFRDGFDEAAETAAVLGHRYMVLPSLPRAELASAETVRRLADEMNRFGERCREADLRFAFHNHAIELSDETGVVPLQVFLENTDPELVTIEIDLFWLVHGGGEPLEYFATYPGRFELCHVKDRTQDGEMVDVGNGVIDFATILGRAEQAGLKHFFVEHDTPGDAAASIAASHRHLHRLDVPD